MSYLDFLLNLSIGSNVIGKRCVACSQIINVTAKTSYKKKTMKDKNESKYKIIKSTLLLHKPKY